MDVDQKLMNIAGSSAAGSIAEVIDRMQAIDALLPGDDGLKWFNRLYMLVTNAVREQPGAAGWSRPDWLARLDVLFANMYFAAIRSGLTSSITPKSWKVLFESRQLPGIDRIQYALAGMNAHINRDLSLALLQTDEEFHMVPLKNGPEHTDFERVNDLLAAVLPKALEFLATGLVGEIVQSTGKLGKLMTLWNVRVARDLAWDFADNIRDLNGGHRQFALSTQDQLTGAIGRSLLLV